MTDRKRLLAVSAALIACLLHLLLSLAPFPSFLSVPIAALLPFALSRLLFGRRPQATKNYKGILLFPYFLPVLIAAAMLLSMLASGESALPRLHPAILFLYYVILPAVFEEVFYRQTLLPLLLPISKAAAVLVSSLFFAALHAPSAMPYAFVCGVLLAVAYLESGSVLLPICLHFTNNALSFLLYCVDGMQWLYLPALVLCLLGSIPAVYFYLKHKGIARPKGEKREKL